MPRNSPDFILNSLKGRIWLAVGSIAVFNCVCGLLAYLGTSFSAADPIYLIILTFFLSSVATLAFGWWLAKEVLRPVDKVSRLAQSLERSPTMSLPKTTGASETDELLFAIHRNGQQLQNLIAMMDDVASGKTQTAIAPLQNSDRLSASFQKLVSKVTDSIDAKRQLVALQTAVTRLNRETSGVRMGRLDVNVTSDVAETRELVENFKYLLARAGELVGQIKTGAQVAGSASGEIKNALRAAIEEDESKTVKLKRAAALLYDVPTRIEATAREIIDASADAERSIDDVVQHARLVANHGESVGQLRGQLTDVVKGLQKVRSRASSVPKISKTAEDLARRCKLVSLNASLAPSEGKGKHGAATLADEIGGLSLRAEGIFRELSTLNEALLRDTAEVENAIKSAAERCGEAVKNAAGGTALAEGLERCVSRLRQLPEKAAELTSGTSDLRDAIWTDDLREGAVSSMLAEAERNALRLLRLAGDLSDSISSFRNSVPTVYRDSQADRKEFVEAHPVIGSSGQAPAVTKS